ncbi:MAG: hypothetical protein KF901_05335 [Myxococcales bacterium]|nr:hypothetical protein [Myxococcales bacterium]
MDGLRSLQRLGARREVDEVQVDELAALAERLVTSLLGDRTLEETLTRRTVLRADSEAAMRRVRGDGRFLFAIGTELIAGKMPRAPRGGEVERRFHVVAPLVLSFGARNHFRAWALDAAGSLLVGTSRQSPVHAGRGHADYTFGFTAALRFLRYARPDAMSSLYGGGGASFQIHRYLIMPGTTGRDQGLIGGGMNLDLVLGVELMRTSALGFFLEAVAHVPTYLFDSQNVNGRLEAYLPGLLVQIGLLR